MIKTLSIFIIAWVILSLIALILISLRKDSQRVLNDLNRFVSLPFPFNLFTIIVTFISLPLSLPYLIAYFIRKK